MSKSTEIIYRAMSEGAKTAADMEAYLAGKRNFMAPGKSWHFNLERAYEEYASRPMPRVNQAHLHDRPKHQLEEDAIRGEVSWIARKYGLTFRQLDSYIEEKSKLLFKAQ